MGNGVHFVAISGKIFCLPVLNLFYFLGGTTRKEPRIFVLGWVILVVPSTQHQEVLAQYMLVTGCARGGRSLCGTVHYSLGGKTLPHVLIRLIKGWLAQAQVQVTFHKIIL